MFFARTTWFLLLSALFCHGLLSSRADKHFSSEETAHWAFQKVRSPLPPEDLKLTWGHNAIDAFILKKLEISNISPSSPAEKSSLLRRATFDLIGLPPTADELEDFLSDDSSEAFEKVIDRLLLSPHYGERWARHWLDLARYAESEGFKADETRPDAWRYRDYVINSFNEDKPYDRFLMEQIAGDELWPDDPNALIATAFNRHYPDESNARNLMQRRQEILNDVTDTVGAVFTGLTFGCARCHDHKFDPILQKDYYRLQAFFANCAANDNVPLASPPNRRNTIANWLNGNPRQLISGVKWQISRNQSARQLSKITSINIPRKFAPLFRNHRTSVPRLNAKWSRRRNCI